MALPIWCIIDGSDLHGNVITKIDLYLESRLILAGISDVVLFLNNQLRNKPSIQATMARNVSLT